MYSWPSIWRTGMSRLMVGACTCRIFCDRIICLYFYWVNWLLPVPKMFGLTRFHCICIKSASCCVLCIKALASLFDLFICITQLFQVGWCMGYQLIVMQCFEMSSRTVVFSTPFRVARPTCLSICFVYLVSRAVRLAKQN